MCLNKSKTKQKTRSSDFAGLRRWVDSFSGPGPWRTDRSLYVISLKCMANGDVLCIAEKPASHLFQVYNAKNIWSVFRGSSLFLCCPPPAFSWLATLISQCLWASHHLHRWIFVCLFVFLLLFSLAAMVLSSPCSPWIHSNNRHKQCKGTRTCFGSRSEVLVQGHVASCTCTDDGGRGMHGRKEKRLLISWWPGSVGARTKAEPARACPRWPSSFPFEAHLLKSAELL